MKSLWKIKKITIKRNKVAYVRCKLIKTKQFRNYCFYVELVMSVNKQTNKKKPMLFEKVTK